MALSQMTADFHTSPATMPCCIAIALTGGHVAAAVPAGRQTAIGCRSLPKAAPMRRTAAAPRLLRPPSQVCLDHRVPPLLPKLDKAQVRADPIMRSEERLGGGLRPYCGAGSVRIALASAAVTGSL